MNGAHNVYDLVSAYPDVHTKVQMTIKLSYLYRYLSAVVKNLHLGLVQ